MTCQTCGDTGVVLAQMPHGKTRPMSCRDCEAGLSDYRRLQSYVYSGKPEASSIMAHWTFESWLEIASGDGDKADAYTRVRQLALRVIAMQTSERPQAMVISGDYGTGKSGLAASAMNMVLWFMRGVWIDVQAEILNTYMRHQAVPHPELLTAPFIVFDHSRFSKQEMEQATTDTVWYSIVPRLRSGLPTIITTPHPITEWEDMLPPEHLAVIRRHAEWVELGGINLRRKDQFDPDDVI